MLRSHLPVGSKTVPLGAHFAGVTYKIQIGVLTQSKKQKSPGKRAFLFLEV
jgi:hypothetical protein